MAASADFRRLADELGRHALVELEKMDGGDAADFLRDIAHAGKAAMEAAQAAEVGPGEIVRALDALRDELDELELSDLAGSLSPADFLGHVLGVVRQLRRERQKTSARDKALISAYRHAAGRLLLITRQAEAAESETSMRVARQNRAALTASVVELEGAGLSIPIEEPR